MQSPGNRTHVFFYDNRYELTSETHPDFGTLAYSFDKNGNRLTCTGSAGTDHYGVDAANHLLWVNRGVNSAPTSGQASSYTLFTYDANGRMTRRERRYNSGLLQVYDFLWDGQDRLRIVNEGANNRLTASYSGSGLRVSKTDTWTGTHDYSRAGGGIVYDSNGGGVVMTPGLGMRANGMDRFCHCDWLGPTRYLKESTGTRGMYTAAEEVTVFALPSPGHPYHQESGGATMQAEIERLLARREGHFELESGHHGNLWLDLELLMLHPDRVLPVAEEWARRAALHDLQAICGPLVEGAFVGLLVASSLRLPFTYAAPVRTAGSGLFAVNYTIPTALRSELRGKRVAIVNDVINAGSAVRGTLAALRQCGAEPVVIAALAVLGDAADALAESEKVALDALASFPNQIWEPAACPLCKQGIPMSA